MFTRTQKQEIIEKLAEKLQNIKSAVFVDYRGLKVSQLKELRRKLKAEQGELKVAKKTLIDLSLKKAGFNDISPKSLLGQIALVFSNKDEISAAKILDQFSRQNKNLIILGVIFEGKLLGQKEALALARVPSKEQSLAGLVGTLNAPIANCVYILRANLRNLVFVLSQIKK